MLAQVRKFVASEKYEGPTKSGVAMGGDVLVSVIDALTRLKAEAPGAKGEQFAKVHKAGDTDIIVTVIPRDDLKALRQALMCGSTWTAKPIRARRRRAFASHGSSLSSSACLRPRHGSWDRAKKRSRFCLPTLTQAG
jgi:hypothetical protein